jgi:hypothetical protein
LELEEQEQLPVVVVHLDGTWKSLQFLDQLQAGGGGGGSNPSPCRFKLSGATGGSGGGGSCGGHLVLQVIRSRKYTSSKSPPQGNPGGAGNVPAIANYGAGGGGGWRRKCSRI